MRVHALAQGRARRDSAKPQRTFEEGVVPKALDGIEIAFSHAQKGEVGFENLAVSHARAHGELGIDQRIDVDSLEIFADKSKASMGAEVVGQFIPLFLMFFESRWQTVIILSNVRRCSALAAVRGGRQIG